MQTTRHSQIDEDLRDSVQRQLVGDRRISAENIRITSNDGTVTLTGSVPSYFQKVVAEQVASSVSGVRLLTNEIEVAALHKIDPEFAQDVVQAMKRCLGGTTSPRRPSGALSDEGEPTPIFPLGLRDLAQPAS